MKEGFKGRVKYNDGPNPIASPPAAQPFDPLDTTTSSSASSATAGSTANSQRWLFFDSETDEPEQSIAQVQPEFLSIFYRYNNFFLNILIHLHSRITWQRPYLFNTPFDSPT